VVRSACARCAPSPPACVPPQQQAAKQALQSKQHKQHSNHRNTSNREWAQTAKGGKGEGSRLHCSRNLPPPVSARLCTTAARCPKHLNPPPPHAERAQTVKGGVLRTRSSARLCTIGVTPVCRCVNNEQETNEGTGNAAGG